MTKKCLFIISSFVVLIIIYWPSRHARHYDYIVIDDITNELIYHDRNILNHNIKNCDYEDVINNNINTEIGEITKIKRFFSVDLGGEFVPIICHSRVKTAIIVPYRNRSQQLQHFLNYMHYFLQNQNVSYRIFVVNQSDVLPFNRAKMLNYGARVAMEMGFACLILHDVDLLPLNSGNIYGCPKRPRHMSSSVDTFRFNLPYLSLFGGVVAISAEHFKAINGMSNQFFGWGGEDDDFYKRLEIHNLKPCRFTPELSMYAMMVHKKERASPSRFSTLKQFNERHRLDGLASLPTNYTIKLEDLYTLIIAS